MEEGIYEMISQEPDGFLASSLMTISNLVGNPSREQKPAFNNAGAVDPLVFVPRPSFFRAVTVRRIIFALVITAVILGIFYLVS